MAFEYHNGICSCGCGKSGMIVVKAGYLAQCNERIKRDKKAGSQRVKPIEPVTDYAEKIRITQALKGLPTMTTGDKASPAPLKRSSVKQKPRKVTGEGAVFEQIWDTRLHLCEVCEEPITRKDGGVGMFSHVLSKGAATHMRLKEEFILLMGDDLNGNCDCHPVWEARTEEMRSDPKWKPVFLLLDAAKKMAHETRKNKPLYSEDENDTQNNLEDW